MSMTKEKRNDFAYPCRNGPVTPLPVAEATQAAPFFPVWLQALLNACIMIKRAQAMAETGKGRARTCAGCSHRGQARVPGRRPP